MLEVVERWFDDTGLAHGHRPATAAQPGDVRISGADDWSWVAWPAYFAPRDLAASQVLSREQILQDVWGFDYLGDSNLVDVRIKYLRDKLEFGGRSRLIQTVRGAGYALRG